MKKILEGTWSEHLRWEFYIDNDMPTRELCTAVFGVGVMVDGRIVLTRNHRGWELPGGHIEPGESIEQALIRESLEEGGFEPVNPQLFGFRKVIAAQPVANDHHGGFYPLVSYIPHFVATVDKDLLAVTGEEIHEAAAFEVQALPALGSSQAEIIQAGLEALAIRTESKSQRLSI
jgi:8-oxo-dGTP pyrophosphatase MutT (NUDIX family)